jgi:shikimate kinase
LTTLAGPVFLVGYRGTGKSAVAAVLAKQLGWSVLDADSELEKRAGQTIREIFATAGEAAFRKMESDLLPELCGLREHVIATGGGVVLHPENRRLLMEGGKVVWLTADAGTIWSRLQSDPTTALRRPDLTVGGLAEIEEMLRLREPWYAQCAHLTVDTAARTPEEVASTILAAISPWPVDRSP